MLRHKYKLFDPYNVTVLAFKVHIKDKRMFRSVCTKLIWCIQSDKSLRFFFKVNILLYLLVLTFLSSLFHVDLKGVVFDLLTLGFKVNTTLCHAFLLLTLAVEQDIKP